MRFEPLRRCATSVLATLGFASAAGLAGSADPTQLPRGPAGAAVQGAVASTPQSANLDHGREIFTIACVVCHGETGQGGGGHGGPALTHTLTRESIVTVVMHGRNQMPAFGSALEAQDLNDLTAYVLQISRGR